MYLARVRLGNMLHYIIREPKAKRGGLPGLYLRAQGHEPQGDYPAVQTAGQKAAPGSGSEQTRFYSPVPGLQNSIERPGQIGWDQFPQVVAKAGPS